MSNIYEEPVVEIIDLYYDTDIIRTSTTDLEDENLDTFIDDPWGDDEE